VASAVGKWKPEARSHFWRRLEGWSDNGTVRSYVNGAYQRLILFGSRRQKPETEREGEGRENPKQRAEKVRKLTTLPPGSPFSLKPAASVSRRFRLPWYLYHCIHLGCYCGNIKQPRLRVRIRRLVGLQLEAGHPYLLCQCWRFVL